MKNILKFISLSKKNKIKQSVRSKPELKRANDINQLMFFKEFVIKYYKKGSYFGEEEILS